MCVDDYEFTKKFYNARAGRIDENSLHAFTLSIVAKGTPLLLGAGLRAVPTRGAYNSAQIWWSSNWVVHP